MRSSHGRAAKKCVRIIGGVSAGASRVARGGDIGFYPAASIDCDRAAAAKGSDVVGTGVQRANGVGSRIQGWRIYHSGTRRPGITRCHHHLDTGGSLCFTAACNVANEQPSEGGQGQEVLVILGGLVGLPLL